MLFSWLFWAHGDISADLRGYSKLDLLNRVLSIVSEEQTHACAQAPFRSVGTCRMRGTLSVHDGWKKSNVNARTSCVTGVYCIVYG